MSALRVRLDGSAAMAGEIVLTVEHGGQSYRVDLIAHELADVLEDFAAGRDTNGEPVVDGAALVTLLATISEVDR